MVNENFEYIILALFIVVIVLNIIVISYNASFSKYFLNKKFKLKSEYEYDPLEKQNKFTISFFNNNINDVRIVGFGFVYKEQSVDYYKTYLKEKGLSGDIKIITISRDAFKYSVDVIEMQTIISDYNKGSRKVSKIICYVTDSQGIMIRIKAKAVRKVISKKLKEIYFADLQEIKKIRKMHQEENRQENRKAKEMKRLKFKDKYHEFRLKLKKSLKNKN